MSTKNTDLLEDISLKESSIIKREKDLKEEEKKILTAEKNITKLVTNEIKQEKEIVNEVPFQKQVIRKLKKHRITFQVIIVIGVILVWRGTWGIFDQLPIISSSFVSLILGILLLWYFNRITDLS